MPKRTTATLDVDGTKVSVSNLEKVFYPETGFTKGDVIDYYIKISPLLLPHLRDRPISFKRYPDGVKGFFFYEKQRPSHSPKWVRSVKVAKTGGTIDYCLLNDLPSLVWAANLADLELHTFLHRRPALSRPTALAFDLDPGPPADIRQCCRVALLMQACFQALHLEAFAKTSGSKGLQVYVPLNTAVTYDRTKEFAHTMARELESLHPKLVTSLMKKTLRKGKIFIDWSQNDDKKTTVNVYSLRAKDRPTVSTPVTWDEVATCAKGRKLSFTSDQVLRRVEKLGDLFAPVLTLKQKLPTVAALRRVVHG